MMIDYFNCVMILRVSFYSSSSGPKLRSSWKSKTARGKSFYWSKAAKFSSPLMRRSKSVFNSRTKYAGQLDGAFICPIEHWKNSFPR